MTRTAISPRFAINTLENTLYRGRVDAARARSALAGTRFGDLEWIAETGSTNADLMAAARETPADRVLIADHQRAGRGRLDRRWDAPPGASLLMSVAVTQPFPAAGAWLVLTALGVAAHDAVASTAGVPVGLKWPNDLVAVGTGANGTDLKLGGMLAERVDPSGRSASVVAGLGVNVNWPEGFPPELASTATSVNLLGGHADRVDLVVDILLRFDALLEPTPFSATACELLLDAYRRRCVTIGREVRAELSTGNIEGTAIEVASDGALIVRDGQGGRHAVTAGDVVHLRPTS